MFWKRKFYFKISQNLIIYKITLLPLPEVQGVTFYTLKIKIKVINLSDLNLYILHLNL